MKSLICKLRRRHDWKIWSFVKDHCETCGVFRLCPSGDILRLHENGYKALLYGNQVAGQSSGAGVPDTAEPIADSEPAPLLQVRPGPRARPSSLAERARA